MGLSSIGTRKRRSTNNEQVSRREQIMSLGFNKRPDKRNNVKKLFSLVLILLLFLIFCKVIVKSPAGDDEQERSVTKTPIIIDHHEYQRVNREYQHRHQHSGEKEKDIHHEPNEHNGNKGRDVKSIMKSRAAAFKAKTLSVNVPSNIEISVLLMNYGRPDVLKTSRLLPSLTSHENVGEIFLLHANQETRFEYKHDKVRNIDAYKENDEMGLSIRFHFCDKLVTMNDWVLIIDDDIEFPPESLTFLLSEFMVDSKRIIGRWGRNLNFGDSHTGGYNTKMQNGKCEVVLTKFMLMEQSICKAFREYEYLVKDFVQQNSKPYWNGEDIFMSLVANYVYGYMEKREYGNCAYPELQVRDIGRNDGIHGTDNKVVSPDKSNVRHNHEVYRGQLW
eukprot:CAMPEP_0116070610 /NCGR_PEP_ID=MMETSP0322-20121206/13168_1 /TAXON_ID=163516 /ORGANISM="Leptocylindrus danicus var. apora, Strain B651" /LENGTH=389 /DNA_ID=CAMNT_0003558563 /DNA_START=156 /DNA_END=1322 /DNA_ORIENTATION=-